jgi:hypothetical protein
MFKIVTRAKANQAKREPFAIQTQGKPPREGAIYHGAKTLDIEEMKPCIILRFLETLRFQGHNLSSTQVSAFIHDLALLQPVMNAVGPVWGAWIHSVENRGGVARLNLLKLAYHQDAVRYVYESIAEHDQIFKHHYSDLRIHPLLTCTLHSKRAR